MQSGIERGGHILNDSDVSPQKTCTNETVEVDVETVRYERAAPILEGEALI